VVEFFRSGPKRSIGAAVLIGCLFVFLAFVFFNRNLDRRKTSAKTIGSVTGLVGEADFRFPGALTNEKLTPGSLLKSGESIAVHEASQVNLRLLSGASVLLQPGARIVFEIDSTQVEGAVLATLIYGDADVTAKGNSGGFRLMKEGRDITATGSHSSMGTPLILNGGARVFPVSNGAAREVVIAPTAPVETPTPIQQSPTRMGDENGDHVSKDSLSNDEIRRAMGNEAGFYRRCYLTYLNRVSKTGETGSTVTVGFVISNSGKVRDAKIVRTDFNDSVLNGCVLETVGRTPFRGFKGSDIPILEFPIELK
jgi:hypothetical protein